MALEKDVQLHLVDSVEDAGRMMTWLGQQRPILAVDTETQGLQWWHHKVRLIQLGDAMTGWAIPWDQWGGVALEALTRYDGPMVMHNAKFDVHMLETWAWRQAPLPRHLIHDTRVMAHILEPHKPTGLKILSTFHVDRNAAMASRVLDEAMARNGWDWATVPIDFEPYWAYGALDTVLTARLYDVLYPQVMTEAPKAYDMEMASQWVAAGMERRGCALDVEYTSARLIEFERFVEEAEAWCISNFGVKPGSNQAVIKRMQQDGVEFSKLTDSGALSLDKDVLEEVTLRTGHPLAQVILERRRLQKLASTYLANFLKLNVDGRVHPSFNTAKTEKSKYGTRTGRQVVTDPPLQTLPRRSESSPAAITVRNCITGSEGSSLVLCDFDQIEMRMFGHFSEDPGLMGAFGHGDFFTNVCRELWADPTIVKKDERRQHTKNGMYALGYGAGAEKIALTTGQTLDAVQQFLDLLAVRFPGIKALQKQVEAVAMERQRTEGAPYVRSPLTGRKFIADDGKAYALVNYLIQGTAAEVLKIKNLELAAAGLEQYMVLNVHDEVILDVPDDIVAEVAPVVQSIVQDNTLFKVPLTAGVDITKRWGEKGA